MAELLSLGGMNTHFYTDLLYIWCPVIFAVGSVVGSGLVLLRQRSVIHGCLSIAVLACALWALFTFYRMFALEEHKVQMILFMGRVRLNFVPYLVTLVAFSIFAAQSFYVLSRRPNAA